MAMFRTLLISATAAAVTGLTLDAADRSSVSLDPELINTGGETFHVTQPGEYLMIGLPETADVSDPTSARLLVTAEFEKLGDTACEDIMIRSVTMEGYVLGDNITKITAYAASDVFNSTTAVGLNFTNLRTNGATMDYEEVSITQFGDYVPWCSIGRPRGFIRAPTKRSYRQRTRIFTMECNFMVTQGGEVVSNIVILHWSTVWRGQTYSEARGLEDVYANDLSLSISDVGTSPIGLLGTDDHTDATVAIPGCNKAQPVNGPFQTRRAKGKPWQQRHHAKYGWGK